MPIFIKSADEIKKMRESGAIVGGALALLSRMISPNVTTLELDKAAEEFIRSHGATPSFLGYNGFPKSVCISINEEVIHGIPGKRRLCEGDIVSVDIGAYKDGFHGDAARTFACGNISELGQRLIDVTKQCFFEGLKFACEGCRVVDISRAIQTYVESNGFSIVRDFIGHGVGKDLHESPEIPNYVSKLRGPTLRTGMTIAVEPMVTAGGYAVKRLADDWTIVSKDGSLSAHYENSILINGDSPELLTVGECDA